MILLDLSQSMYEIYSILLFFKEITIYFIGR